MRTNDLQPTGATPPLASPRGRPRRSTIAATILVLLVPVACGDTVDWTPLDGPWDPEHPEARAILEPPEPGSPIDHEMADAGERWYRVRGCLACHRVDGSDVVGPALNGVTVRREYDWYRGMVMRPDSMLQVDPIARELARVYRVPMPDQGVDELRTRAIWEYLRRIDAS